MRLEDQRRSENVEDRRGMTAGRGLAGGGIGVVVVALIAMFLGVDPTVFLQSGIAPSGGVRQQAATATPSREDRMGDFVAAVLGSTEDVWGRSFPAAAGPTASR